MKILLVEEDAFLATAIQSHLKTKFQADVQLIDRLQAAIELMEGSNWEPSDLVVCDYHGNSTTMMKCLVDLCVSVPCIFIFEDKVKFKAFSDTAGAHLPEPVARAQWTEELTQRITSLMAQGLLKENSAEDSDYIKTPVTSFAADGPLMADIFIQLNSNRYCKIFKKGDVQKGADLQKYFEKKLIKNLFIPRDQYQEFVKAHQTRLDDLQKKTDLTSEEVHKVATESIELFQELSGKMGFTPEVQALATKTVDLILKVLGKKPSLMEILTKLKNREGQYIASHSMMLGEVCCAIACTVGWNSSTTYMKLTLASFLHDLSLKDNDLAKCQTLAEATQVRKLNSQEILSFKLHPTSSAEYATKFHEIPSDVDTIIAQHHERPDGTGFPRGLYHNRITPLASLFIIAEDMLTYFQKNPDKATVQDYVTYQGVYYESGTFKKIIRSLASGVPLDDLGKNS